MSQSEDTQEAFFAERGFGLRMGFGDRPALICIDLIRAFTNPKEMLGSNLDTVIDASNALIERAHHRSFPIFFSTIMFEDSDLQDAGLWRYKSKGASTLKVGTDGVELDSRIDFRKGDQLIVKKYASCFFGTDLISRLATFNIDTLIITGCTTSGCVRATAVDAFQYGVRPMVVREAVGDRTQAAHEQSLFDLNAKYADVVSLEETQDYLKQVRIEAPTSDS